MATTAPPTVGPELRSLLRRLKLGRSLDTLPERLALARQNELGHAEFLELVLADEVDRRDRTSAGLRARAAHLDPAMVLEAWDDTAAVSFDRALWSELTTLRFVEDANNVLALGPVGVGKTFLATALGHIAVRRRISVHFERADQLLKRLKASRLDASHDAEMRKLIRVELLILDDYAAHRHGPRRHGRGLRACRRAAPTGVHRHHVQPRPGRVAGGDGRPAPRPVSHRPVDLGGL